MTRAQRVSYRLRWLILAAAVVMIGLYLWFLFFYWPLGGKSFGYSLGESVYGTPLMVLGDSGLEGYADAFITLGILLITQWLFLRPGPGWSVKMAKRARPMRTSVLGAAFMAMLLTVGLVVTLAELPNWWRPWLDRWEINRFWVLFVMLLVWGVWAAIFFVYWRQGDRYTQIGRVIRGLIAGSVLEMIIAAPIQAMNLHKDDCYCARGSYTGLVFGGTVLVWCFGPGVVLLMMRERYRRAALLVPVCSACGYDLRATIGVSGHCPECGQAIPEQAGYHAADLTTPTTDKTG